MTAPMGITAPVMEVTLLEDRAQVTRRGRTTLPAGRSSLRLAGLAPIVNDKTVVVRLVGPSEEIRVLGAVVRRESRITREEGLERLRELRDVLGEKQTELERLRIERDLAGHEVQELRSLGDLTLTEFAEDTAWGRAPRERWSEDLERLRERIGPTEVRHRELGFGMSELVAAIERIEARLRQLGVDAGATRRAELVIDVEAKESGDHEIRIDYVVPGACWRPYHTARLDPSEASISFECTACVWQHTGEAWEDATLRFSTLRPSLGTSPPRLSTDRLAARPRTPDVEVEAREQAIHTTGLGAGQTVEGLPGIDDGGETLELSAPRPATVPSDGRPHRVPLFSFETGATTELVVTAELDPCAHLKSVQSNDSPHPILAGPVDLVRNGGRVGRTTVLFVAPGERFGLGWGPDPDLRVRRSASTTVEKKSLTGAWHRSVVEVTTDVSNIGTTPKELELIERVPVSEIEPVQIEADPKGTTEGPPPDADGFLRWSVRLEPDEQETRVARYEVRRHKSVVGLDLGID